MAKPPTLAGCGCLVLVYPPRCWDKQFVREYPGSDKVRQDLQIATKFAPYPYRIGSESIVKACDETLERVEADVSVAFFRK